MTKRVLDVGNCGPDHASITELICHHFDAVVDQADRGTDALDLLAANQYSLALVNRLLDCDGSEGLDVIRALREQYPDVPVMMITNYPEHQQQAIESGAQPGFGKQDLRSDVTKSLLATYLS